MPRTESWEPCRVDPYQGFAFFDGILIEPDSIKDPRHDRVIPVFEEEQVFVSRLLRHRLLERPVNSAPLRVLDVGTGCGVYAIVAAKLGCCVLAVDQSDRACMFAEENAQLNQVPLTSNPAAIPPGHICVRHEEFRPGFRHGGFDAVVLSPGYNPTHPVLQRLVATHAAAGPIGEEQFREQIQVVPAVLRPGGICFGNQMTPVTGGGRLPAGVATCADLLNDDRSRERLLMIGQVRDAFKNRFSLRCVPILSGLKETADFLREQYRDLEGHLHGLSDWQDEVSRHNPYLVLLYYEVENEGHGQVSLGRVPWSGRPEETSHRRDWGYRISLHKAIVEHTSEKGFTPLPLLVADGVADAILSRRSRATDNRDLLSQDRLPPDKVYGVNLYALIDREIQNQRLGNLFSVIFLDTTPVYPSEKGVRTLINENRVWIEGQADFRQDSVRRTVSNRLLKEWLLTVAVLQRAKCGPFAHPAFVGLADRALDWKWPEILFTETPCLEMGELEAARSVVQYFFDQERASVFAVDDNWLGVEVWEDLGYSRSSLGDLDMADYQSNERQFVTRLQRLEAELARAPLQYSREVLARLDLKACQRVMHETLHAQFTRVIDEDLPALLDKSKQVTSMLFGVPLGMLFYHLAEPVRGFPPYYKGVLWAYLLPKGVRERAHGEAARHLLRVAGLILNGSYGALSEKALSHTSAEAAKGQAVHSIGPHMWVLQTELAFLNEDLKRFRDRHPDLKDVPCVNQRIFDENGVLLMLAHAANRKELIELPEDCAAILRREWRTESLQEFIDRLPWPPAVDRVLKDKRVQERRDRGELSWDDRDDLMRQYPQPSVRVLSPFQLSSPQGIYPLVLFALRSALQHSYLAALLESPYRQGEVDVSLGSEPGYDQVVVISNTGLSADQQERGISSGRAGMDQPQKGWEQDLHLVANLTRGWRLVEAGTGVYSVLDVESGRWLTKIAFKEAEAAR